MSLEALKELSALDGQAKGLLARHDELLLKMRRTFLNKIVECFSGLTEAEGFRITLHSPNNRYVEDDKTAQAVAQFWARIGLDARVEVMPSNVFFTRAGRRQLDRLVLQNVGGAGFVEADCVCHALPHFAAKKVRRIACKR